MTKPLFTTTRLIESNPQGHHAHAPARGYGRKRVANSSTSLKPILAATWLAESREALVKFATA